MESFIKYISDSTGLKYNQKAKYFYGIFEERAFFISHNKKGNCYKISFSVSSDEEYFSDDFCSNLKLINNHISSVDYEESFEYKVTVSCEKQSAAVVLYNLLDSISALCKEKGLTSCCKKCGRTDEISAYSFFHYGVSACDDCKDVIRLECAERHYAENKESFIAGMSGTLLGGLLTAVLLIFINVSFNGDSNFLVFLGYALTVLTVLAGYKLYDILSGGYITKKAAVFSLIFTMIASVVAYGGAVVIIEVADTQMNFDYYMSAYEEVVDSEITENADSIQAQYGSGEKYKKERMDAYEEYINLFKKPSVIIGLIPEYVTGDSAFRNAFIFKMISTLVWFGISTSLAFTYEKHRTKKLVAGTKLL